LERAKSIASKYSAERVFDIETRQTLSYFYRGDTQKFEKGYNAYKKGVEKGLSSVHGRTMEVYYQAFLGNTDEAVALARRDMGDEGGEAIPLIYERAGRWKEAYEAYKKEAATSDSIDNVVIMNSMQGISDELRLYDVERKASQNKLIMLTIVIALLLLLIGTLVYIVQARRRHFKQLKIAYERALEADKAKTAFIQNVTHEVRTPLNIISGFSQVISDPDLDVGLAERKEMALTMQKNTRLVTSLIDEILILSLTENSEKVRKEDKVEINELMRDFLQENESITNVDTKLQFKSSLPEEFSLQTNENLLKNIINALIDNAAKNTEKGFITMKADKTDDQHVELVVEDTGCGIPLNEAEHIFERFVKLDSFKEGIGLGLPMCRTLAEKLGGSIRLDTSYQSGARFIVTLPIE
jgi:signal transduction histidine kinase